MTLFSLRCQPPRVSSCPLSLGVFLFLWSLGGCVTLTESKETQPAASDQFVTVRYAATDDVASRLVAGESLNRPTTGAPGDSGAALVTPVDAYSSDQKAAFREELLASTADGRRESQLVRLGWEAFERGDVATAVARTREAWILLQNSRSQTLDEDLSGGPVRSVALAYARALLATTERREGIVVLEKIVAASPAWMPAYTALFEHYLERGAAGLSEKVARRALAYADDASGAWPSVLLARSLRAQRRPQDALAVLKVAEIRFPNDSNVTLWTGVVLYDAGFLTESCERFSLAHARLSGNEHAAYNHALCLSREKRWGSAGDVVKLALTLHPQSVSLRLLSGNVSRSLGNKAEAYRVWREFLDMSSPGDPRRPHVENALAELARPDAHADADLGTGTSP